MNALAATALNIGFPVFPCGSDKQPCIPKKDGGRGFLDASRDPDEIQRLFSHHGARLIGVPTGEASGFDVLDLDYVHGAGPWEQENAHRLPETRLHRSKSGGRHYLFRHAPGVRNSASSIAPGVDVRGGGGYIVMPPSAGYSVTSDAEMVDWPDWLLPAVLPKPLPSRPEPTGGVYTPTAAPRLEGYRKAILDGLGKAQEGRKHFDLRNAALALGGIQAEAGFSSADALDWLLAALPNTVKDWNAARRTAAWGLEQGRARPIELEDRPRETVQRHNPPRARPDQEETPPPYDEPSEHDEPAQPASDAPRPLDFMADPDAAPPVLEPRHLPEALYPFVADTSERMGVDPVSVALSCIVACAAVVSDNWRLQPKAYDYTWTESPRLWGAIVGDPSVMKTPVIAACTKPIDKLDAAARADHTDAMRVYKKHLAAFKADKTGATPEPTRPKLVRYLVEGTTTEALSEVLRTDDEATQHAPAGKVLCRQDEMSEFLGNMDRYKSGGKSGGDRGAYLRLYNGGSYTVDRIMRGSFSVPNWSACFLGGIQPGPIQKIANDSAEDGLLQRFIYCVPGPQQHGQDRAPDHAAVTRYADLFPALTALHPGRTPDGLHTQTVVFHADAHRQREDVDAMARALALMPDTSARLKAAFGKWPGLFARICITFHLIQIADARASGERGPPDGVIPAATAQRAADFMLDIVLPHMMRADAIMFATAQTGHARWIIGHILSRQLRQISARDVVRNYRELRAPESRKELDATMASLVAVGWLEPEAPSNPLNPVNLWAVNPAVHTLFATKAERERQRREDAKTAIAVYAEISRRRAAA